MIYLSICIAIASLLLSFISLRNYYQEQKRLDKYMQAKADSFDEFAWNPFNHITPELEEQLRISPYDSVKNSVWVNVGDSIWSEINKKIDE